MTTFEKPQEWINELMNARRVCHTELAKSMRLSGSQLAEEALVAVSAIGDLLMGSVIPVVVPTSTEDEGSSIVPPGVPEFGDSGQSETIDDANDDGITSGGESDSNPFGNIGDGGF